jgi:thiol-disulfide isomerase/thioredoxin
MIWADFDMNNEELFKCSALYARLLGERVTQLAHQQLEPKPALRAKNINELKFDVVKTEVQNSLIKQNLLYTYTLLLLNTGMDTDNYFSDYMELATDAVDIAEVRNVYNNVNKTRAENPSARLEYADLDKFKAILATLKGNYVYINVWAEYSEPAKAEIPYMEQLEKKYEKENIKFMSLAVDRFADFRKWKKYVTDNKLGGLQLINDNNPNADFVNEYNISTIPRFILIDPKGNVVSSHTEKPSNPELQKQLDKLLGSQM